MKPQRAMSEEFAPSQRPLPLPPLPRLVTPTFALHFVLTHTHTHTATHMLKRGSNYCLFIYSYSHVWPVRVCVCEFVFGSCARACVWVCVWLSKALRFRTGTYTSSEPANTLYRSIRKLKEYHKPFLINRLTAKIHQLIIKLKLI